MTSDNTTHKNAWDRLQSLPEENREYILDRIYDNPIREIVEDSLRIHPPEILDSLVEESES